MHFKFCRGLVVFTHLKISAFSLAGLMLIWGQLAFGPDNSLFVQTLNEEGIAAQWGVLMMLNGLLLMVGCICPLRSLRHIGLTLCCFQFVALGGYFFQLEVFTPVSASMPWLGLMALITLMAEVKGKPRNACA
jgi:hypothetical protein